MSINLRSSLTCCSWGKISSECKSTIKAISILKNIQQSKAPSVFIFVSGEFFGANFESYEKKPFDKLCSTSVLRSDGWFWKSRWDSGKTNMKVFQTLLLHFTWLAFPSRQDGAATCALKNIDSSDKHFVTF